MHYWIKFGCSKILEIQKSTMIRLYHIKSLHFYEPF